MINVLLAVAVAYAAICALVFLFQPRLVYFPQVAHEVNASPLAAGLKYENVVLDAGDGVKVHAWWIPAREARGAMVLTHGNAGNISHRVGYATMFNRLGYSVLLFDYRGYGKSTGHPDEEGTYRDAAAAWQYVNKAQKFTARDIVLVGESLGGGVATWLAQKHPPRALILASTFTSVPDLGATVYPWLPVRWLARIRYDNLWRIGSIESPVMIAHSPGDDIVPYRHGQTLFAAAREPKEMLELAGGHNEGFIFARDAWIDAIARFLERAEKKPQ